MVKLQKHKAYTYKSDSGEEIDHYKYVINIPESALGELGWSEGQELNFQINRHSLILEPSPKSNMRDDRKK